MPNYFKAVIWFILSLVMSAVNDVATKYMGGELHSVEITFLRFLFGTLTLLPFMFFYGKKAFYTSRISLHLVRAFLLCIAIALWCFGLTQGPIAVATTLTFTIPMFVLVLAAIFLKEKVTLSRWVVTLIGFIGAIIVLEPANVNFSPLILLLVLSTALYAILDVVNKKYVISEGILAMLFYTALFTTLFAAIPTIYLWKTPSMQQIFILFFLGCGANVLLYCMLKAYQYAEASALAPFRYVELIVSASFGVVLFGEIPSTAFIIGAIVIIPCTLFLALSESRKEDEELSVEEEPSVQRS